jgi:hypothetical protein
MTFTMLYLSNLSCKYSIEVNISTIKEQQIYDTYQPMLAHFLKVFTIPYSVKRDNEPTKNPSLAYIAEITPLR